MQKATPKPPEDPYVADIAAVKGMRLVADAEVGEKQKNGVTYLTVTTQANMLTHASCTEEKPYLAPYQFRIALAYDKADEEWPVENWIPEWRYLIEADAKENRHPTWYLGATNFVTVCMGSYEYEDYTPARKRSLKESVEVALQVLQTIL